MKRFRVVLQIDVSIELEATDELDASKKARDLAVTSIEDIIEINQLEIEEL